MNSRAANHSRASDVEMPGVPATDHRAFDCTANAGIVLCADAGRNTHHDAADDPSALAAIRRAANELRCSVTRTSTAGQACAWYLKSVSGAIVRVGDTSALMRLLRVDDPAGWRERRGRFLGRLKKLRLKALQQAGRAS